MASTITSVFDRYAVSEDVDYLSIDIDSADLWIFREIISSGRYRPRVISVEYNCNFPLESTLVNVGGDYRWMTDRIAGSALLPLKMVGDEFGYSIVDVIPYLDAIFVRNDLLNGSKVPPFETWRQMTNISHHIAKRRSEIEILQYLVDYEVWRKTPNNVSVFDFVGINVAEQIRRLNIQL